MLRKAWPLPPSPSPSPLAPLTNKAMQSERRPEKVRVYADDESSDAKGDTAPPPSPAPAAAPSAAPLSGAPLSLESGPPSAEPSRETRQVQKKLMTVLQSDSASMRKQLEQLRATNDELTARATRQMEGVENAGANGAYSSSEYM